ncbi:MAG: extracellular solute-binding protein [Spirochaetota bacterium]
MRRTLLVSLLLLLLVMPVFSGGQGEATGSADRILPSMTGNRLVEETVTMTAAMLVEPTQSDPEDLAAIQMLQEVTNVDFEFETIPESNYDQRLNLIFAAGEMPDVLPNGGPPSFIVQQAANGTIIPYNDLIENWTVNIKEAFERRPDFRQALTLPDGNIYSLWMVEETAGRNWLDPYMINRVWLDRLGLEMPRTTEELRDVLIAFRDEDANGNGDPNDEIPLSWRETGWGGQRIDTFFGAFDIRSSEDQNHMAWEDGRAFLAAADPRYREALEYLNDLYEEDLVDPESFTQDVAQLRAKAQADRLGSFIFFWPPNITGNELFGDFELLEPLQGPIGEPTGYLAQFIGGFDPTQWLITSTNPYPEVAIRIADVMLDGDEMSLNIAYGPEGHFWERLPDNRWTLNSSLIPDGLGEVQWRDQATSRNLPSNRDRDLYERFDGDPQSTQVVRARWFTEGIEPYLRKDPPPDFWFDDATNAEVTSIATELNTYVAESRARFVLEGITDSEWDDYLRDLQRIGSDRLIEIYQQAYEDFYSN